MRLHNSLTGRKELFVPLREGEVRMYHCGPTVYSRAHIGNFRAYVAADLLRRTFEWLGYRVLQVMNITDVGHMTEDEVADAQGEDKLEKAARERKVDPLEIAREVEAWFHEDLAALNCRPAHRYPRATEHIPEMIAMIEALIERGHAYVADGNVYFAVESFPGYGKLSGNRLEDMLAGASGRVGERGDKRTPLDFALWKHDPKHLMQWDSPWGRGFPGWHIECSAMSVKYLGETFDIHTGGPDNKFPHHECEIAQTESVTGETFVRYWLHPGWLEIGGAKMAKSKGKLYLVPELLAEGFSGLDIRWCLVRQHYRSPLPFTLELLSEAARGRERLDNFVHHELADRPEGPSDPAIAAAVEQARAGFRTALEDDLNTSGALAAVFDLVAAVNRLEPSRADAEAVRAFMTDDVDAVLGVLGPPPADLDAEVEAKIAERKAARAARDYARADAIRDELLARGIELLDTPQGVRWRKTR